MRDIRSVEDILQLLDGFFTRGPDWWDGFYADRDKPVPFFAAKPDESLVSRLDRGLIEPGRALDLGCGPGRNAIHLASNGHLAPHRRVTYLAFLDRCLAPGGHLALSCFADGGMRSETPDAELYRRGDLEGGLAYPAEALRTIFSDLTEIELRRMYDEPDDSPYFGEPDLWTALFRRD